MNSQGLKNKFKLKSKLWLYPGMEGWHFLTLPKKQSADIKRTFGKQKRGWGSLRVEVTIGKTSWNTSIFPDKKSGAYVLPVKSDVRRKEEVGMGDIVQFTIMIRG